MYKRQLYANTRDVERYFVVAGNPTVSQGISFVGLTDWKERERNTGAVVKELFPKFMAIPGVLAFPVLPPSLGQSPRERPVNFVIVTSASYAELDQMTGKILAEVAKNPGFTNVDTDLKLNKPEPVSYTHLGVYKRQALPFPVSRCNRCVDRDRTGGRQVGGP